MFRDAFDIRYFKARRVIFTTITTLKTINFCEGFVVKLWKLSDYKSLIATFEKLCVFFFYVPLPFFAIPALFQIFKHVCRHRFKIVFRFPIPMFLRLLIVDALRPAIGNLLPEIGFVTDGKIRDMFLNTGCNFFG